MKRRKLGRKGIKLRNNVVFLSIILIVVIFTFEILNKKENKQTQYVIQTQQLIQAQNDIINNTEGTTYYVAAQGTSTEGTEISNPMSLKTANTKTYSANDKILFKSGDTFYGTINFNVQTSEDEYIYIGSYGEGEKPIISGANILTNAQAWTLEDNLYKIDLSNYDNFEGIGKTYWEPYNIGFLADEKGNIYGSRKSSKEEVTNEYDYYCENNYLYLKCSQNPSEKLGKIKFVSRNDLVSLSSNTIMENLDIQYTGAHGIVKTNSELKNVYVKNCIIQNIGGSVQVASTFTRYGNGLEFWNSASNTIVEGCIFRNTYDAGYTAQGNVVTTGFENNICQDNIFINCTYPYETFCRNKDNSSLESQIYLTGQKYINNISINQARGWGYEVRPDKDPAAEFVLWAMPTPNTDIEMYGNKFFNSRRLKYTSAYIPISVETFRNGVKSDNNKIHLVNDTLLMNNRGNYNEKEVLEEYGVEQNSTIRLLTQDELIQINNPTILTSNNYTEIKTYYETLEKDFTYTDAIAPIQEKYTQFKQQNKTTINQTTGLSTQIAQQETYLQQANSTNTTQANLTQQITQTYELGTTILTAYLNNKLDITETELITILHQINEIGQTYNTLYSLLQTQETIDLTNIQNQITKTEEEIEQYKQVNLTQVSALVSNSKTTMQSELKDTIKSTATTYLINWAQELLDVHVTNYVTQNPPTLTYSITALTNQNVTVTLTADYDIQITNNNNSPTYTFEQNDKFTFQYTVRNKSYQITAAVTNIDKTAPKITGVEEGQTYYIEQQIIPKITDINLKEVTLQINGVQIDYEIGEPLIVEGIYKLTATDEAGNIETVQFQVMEKPDEKYIIKENSIQNIKYTTTKTQFDVKVK